MAPAHSPEYFLQMTGLGGVHVIQRWALVRKELVQDSLKRIHIQKWNEQEKQKADNDHSSEQSHYKILPK